VSETAPPEGVTGGRYLPEGWTLPALTDENRAFFGSGELRVQRCGSCANVQHPPAEVCHVCQSLDLDYETADATGVVESFTIVHHALHPMLKDVVPYNVVIVSLRDHPGVRIVGNVVDTAPDGIDIGMPVRGRFVEATNLEGDAVTLLQWSCP
jgi:uncharacterized OB-fold protein